MEIFKDKTPNITLINAPPEPGKTYLVKHILTSLYKKKKIKFGIVFCSTGFNSENYEYIPEDYLHAKFDEKLLLNLMNIQEQQVTLHGKGNTETAFIVFDDMLGLINFKSNIIIELFTKYRHYNIMIIITTQYLFAVPPLLRECTNFFITFRITSSRSVKGVYESFFVDFDTQRECKDYILDNIDGYKFIVVKIFEKEFKKKYLIFQAPEKIKKVNFKF